jgi:arylsulfatase A
MMSKYHRNSILILGFVSCFGCVCVRQNVCSAELPNIVIILADDMGYGDVQRLNPESKIATPNLNRFAAQGMTFTDGHSPSAVCTPTRYGLLTGRYCWRSRLKSGVLGGYSPPLIDRERPTIATMLKSRGYRTAAVGKWHLGMELPLLDATSKTPEKWEGDPGIDFKGVITDSPIHHGFDYYFGVSASLDMAPYVYIRNDRFTMQPSLAQAAVKFPHFVRKGPRAEDFRIDEVLDRLTEEATDFIAKAAQGDQPFFLYMPLTAPHKPTQPHERFRGKTSLGEYGDFVAQVDWTVGQVLFELDQSKVADETLVVYTSDNGSYMYCYDDERDDHVSDSTIQGYLASNHRANGRLRGTKADVWEAGHRVPFFVRWPGEVQPGSTCTTTICLTDLYATMAEIAGAELESEAAEDSCSLVSMLRGKKVDRGAPVINHSAGGMFAIRDGRWKLVAGNGSGGRQEPRGKPFKAPYQLFDLDSDLSETNDVAKQHPEIVQHLTEKLEDIRQRGRSIDR